MRIFRSWRIKIACQAAPSGAIMPPNVLTGAATKQRTCALSDTLSARVLFCDLILAVPSIENINPHEAPKANAIVGREVEVHRNRLAEVGFGLSLIAFGAGWFVVNGVVAIGFTVVSLSALLISLIALLRRPRRLAGWGVAISCFACLFIPTVLHAMIYKLVYG